MEAIATAAEVLRHHKAHQDWVISGVWRLRPQQSSSVFALSPAFSHSNRLRMDICMPVLHQQLSPEDVVPAQTSDSLDFDIRISNKNQVLAPGGSYVHIFTSRIVGAGTASCYSESDLGKQDGRRLGGEDLVRSWPHCFSDPNFALSATIVRAPVVPAIG